MRQIRPLTSTQLKQLGPTDRVTDVVVRKFFDTQMEGLPERCIKFTISTDAVDRKRDRVNQNGWQLDYYLKNPTVLWNHDYELPWTCFGKVESSQ